MGLKKSKETKVNLEENNIPFTKQMISMPLVYLYSFSYLHTNRLILFLTSGSIDRLKSAVNLLYIHPTKMYQRVDLGCLAAQLGLKLAS